MDTNSVGIAHLYLIETDRIFAIGTLTSHLDDFTHTGLIGIGHLADQAGATDIAAGNNTTCGLDDIAQALVLLLHGVAALEGNLAFNAYANGGLEEGTFANLDDVIGFQLKRGRRIYRLHPGPLLPGGGK